MRKVKSVDVLTAGQGINAGLVALSRNVGMVWVMRVVGPRREVDGRSNDASQARLSSRHADCKNAPGKKVDKSINKHAQGSLLIMTFDVFQSLSYPNQRTFITIWIVDVLSCRT